MTATHSLPVLSKHHKNTSVRTVQYKTYINTDRTEPQCDTINTQPIRWISENQDDVSLVNTGTDDVECVYMHVHTHISQRLNNHCLLAHNGALANAK